MLKRLSAVSTVQENTFIVLAFLELLLEPLNLCMTNNRRHCCQLIKERILWIEIVNVPLKFFVRMFCPHLNINNKKNILAYSIINYFVLHLISFGETR
jgi:hypothetical protein